MSSIQRPTNGIARTTSAIPVRTTGGARRKPKGLHPDWCRQGHHCTTDRIGAQGEHCSEPEVWDAAGGRVVGTRYQRGDGTRDRVDMHVVVDLDPDDDAAATEDAQIAIVSMFMVLNQVYSDKMNGHLR